MKSAIQSGTSKGEVFDSDFEVQIDEIVVEPGETITNGGSSTGRWTLVDR